jgi:hypothetical protein
MIDPHTPPQATIANTRTLVFASYVFLHHIVSCFSSSIANTASPSQTTDLKSYSVAGGRGHIAHFVKAKPEALVPGTDPDKVHFLLLS